MVPKTKFLGPFKNFHLPGLEFFVLQPNCMLSLNIFIFFFSNETPMLMFLAPNWDHFIC